MSDKPPIFDISLNTKILNNPPFTYDKPGVIYDEPGKYYDSIISSDAPEVEIG